MSKLNKLLLEPRALVMGILNVTPDSFSDGGDFTSLQAAEQHLEGMLEAGVDIVDIGGESTRPGAADVSLQQELDRVMPLVEVANRLGAVISVDTSKAGVMAEALKAGVELINDIRALQEPEALKQLVDSDAHVCLMHMKGQPRTMQKDPHYDDVVGEVQGMLRQRIAQCIDNGISQERIILDPGFGFGKNLQHNCQLMQALPELERLGYPVLVGVSRKTMIGQLLQQEVGQRMVGSVVAATYAALKGAKILRVHDVAETVQALTIVNAFGKI